VVAARFRILVIDDSEVLLDRMKRALGGEGYEVTTTSRAVGNARHIPNCDLVIIDFHMPGIDGGTVMASLRGAEGEKTHSCQFYLYSSDTTIDFRGLGFDGVLTGKGDEDALVRQVRAIVRLSQLRSMKKTKPPGPTA
jgi:two-component system, OmpR family, response regulator